MIYFSFYNLLLFSYFPSINLEATNRQQFHPYLDQECINVSFIIIVIEKKYQKINKKYLIKTLKMFFIYFSFLCVTCFFVEKFSLNE